MDQNKLYRQYQAFRKRKSAQFAPSIYKALQAQIKFYIETRDLNNLPKAPMIAALTDLYSDVGRSWAAYTFTYILKDAKVKYVPPQVTIKARGSIGLNQQFIDAILEFFNIDGFNAITLITETTRNQIRQIVADGIEQQLSLDEIINNLLTSGITKARAATISRTETGKAANAATEIGAKQTGLKTKKTWLSVRDFRTRFDHVEADNQTVPDDKPFVVGNEGFLMMHPMATKSTDGRRIPGKEIINCRCTFGHTVLRDKQGLPIRVNPF